MSGGCDRECSDEEREIERLRAEVRELRARLASTGRQVQCGECGTWADHVCLDLVHGLERAAAAQEEIRDAHARLDALGALTHMIGSGTEEDQRATLAERIEDVRTNQGSERKVWARLVITTRDAALLLTETARADRDATAAILRRFGFGVDVDGLLGGDS